MNSGDSEDRMDARLAAALEEVRREPVPDVDWDRLRRTIRDRAAPTLRRRQSRRFLARTRSLAPLAIAASVAFALWIGPRVLLDSRGEQTVAELTADPYEEAALMEALVADVSEHEFRQLVTGRANPEALLAVAVGDR